jgi:hypothetical protein
MLRILDASGLANKSVFYLEMCGADLLSCRLTFGDYLLERVCLEAARANRGAGDSYQRICRKIALHLRFVSLFALSAYFSGLKTLCFSQNGIAKQ